MLKLSERPPIFSSTVDKNYIQLTLALSRGWGTDLPPPETLSIIYSRPSVYTFLYLRIQPTKDQDLSTWGCIVLWYLLLKTNMHVSGPVQFKLVLFKSQMYSVKEPGIGSIIPEIQKSLLTRKKEWQQSQEMSMCIKWCNRVFLLIYNKCTFLANFPS